MAQNKYTPLWEALKKDGKVTTAIPIPLQAKVIRGLINLKDRDRIFKLQASEAKKRYKIVYIAESARVRIFLRAYDDLSAISLSDL